MKIILFKTNRLSNVYNILFLYHRFCIFKYIILFYVSINSISKNETNHTTNSSNSTPIELFVETLLVTDLSVYEDHKKYSESSHRDVIFEHMKIYFSHVMNGVINLKSIII